MSSVVQVPMFDASADAVHLIVYGTPAPQGSKKFVGVTKEGRGLLVESSKKVKPWRMDVKAAAELVRDAHAASMPLEGPLVVSMVFTLPKPSSAPKRRQTWPDRKPDVSKLARSTEDALTDAGFWADDARVVLYEVLGKCYPGEHPLALSSPGVRVSVRRLDHVIALSPEVTA
jgi:crossover junction endodeoxyribonuclease RusA